MKVEISIDNLTLVGGWNRLIRDKQQEFQKWLDGNIELEKSGMAQYPYSQWFKFKDGTLLQIAGRDGVKVSPWRIEFNPNKCHQGMVVEFIREFMQSPKITRIDVAIDYGGVCIGDGFDVLYDRVISQRRYWGDDGRLETVYVGSGSSKKSYRVYDKARERRKRGDEFEGELTRVEGQFRGEMPEGAFEGVVLVRGRVWDKLKIHDRAMLEYLRGRPERWKEITNRAHRKKYRSMMVDNSIEVICPREEFQRQKKSLQQLADWWKAPVYSDIKENPFTHYTMAAVQE